MELSVDHVTTFRYAGAVRDSVNEVRLMPRDDAGQRCLDFRLEVAPAAEVRQHRDAYGNAVHTFDVSEPHEALVIRARSRVVTGPPASPLDLLAVDDPYDPMPLDSAGPLVEFLQPTPRADFHPLVAAFAAEVQAGGEPASRLGRVVWRLSRALHERLEYLPGTTDVGTVASRALEARRGVCQDYTHVLLAALRLLGIPARYTSGYFYPEGAKGEVGEQASHAWADVWFPGRGWVGVDPTNDRLVGERYIRVAHGRDYGDVTPIKGSYRGGETTGLDVDVSVHASMPQQ